MNCSIIESSSCIISTFNILQILNLFFFITDNDLLMRTHVGTMLYNAEFTINSLFTTTLFKKGFCTHVVKYSL